MQTSNVLADVDIFYGLHPVLLAKIEEIAQRLTFLEGQEIFHESAPAQDLYVLLNGEIALQVQLSSRNQKITVGMISRAVCRLLFCSLLFICDLVLVIWSFRCLASVVHYDG